MGVTAIEAFLRDTAMTLAVKVLAALAFWIIGRWLIGAVISVMRKAMDRNMVDPTLTPYTGSIGNVALNIALVLGILGHFGIQTTSFAALVAGADQPPGAGHGPRRGRGLTPAAACRRRA